MLKEAARLCSSSGLASEMSLRLGRLRGRIRRPLLRFIERSLLGRGLRGFFGDDDDDDGYGVDGYGVNGRGPVDGVRRCTREQREEEGRGGIGGRSGGGDGSPVGNDTGKDGTKGGTRNGNGNSKRFWQRCNSADSGIGIPDDNDMDSSEVRNDTLGAAIASGTSTSFTFAGSTGWRYISLSDDDHMYGSMHSPHADQDENVGLLGGMRFRGKKNNKGKKVGMFASGIPEEDEHEHDDADGKKKGGGVKGKDGKCGEGWFETLMVHGFGSIAHLYVPCTDFTTFEENDLGGRKEVVGAMMPRQAQAHIVIFDDGLGGIALRDL